MPYSFHFCKHDMFYNFSAVLLGLHDAVCSPVVSNKTPRIILRLNYTEVDYVYLLVDWLQRQWRSG